MLYVSRRIGKDKFGIMDTDDGVEEVCSMHDIVVIIAQAPDIDIKGVNVRRVVRNGQVTNHIDAVEIYQNPAYMRPLQAKTRMLRGVDVKTNGSCIVGITAPGHSYDAPVSVCLNDFGDKCGENIFFGMSKNTDKPVIAVLKDGIALRRNSLSGAYSFGVKIDITAVTDEKLVSLVYHTRAYRDNYGHSYDLLKQFIIDKPERMDFYMACFVVERGNTKSVFLPVQNFHDFRALTCRVADHYRDVLHTLEQTKIIWRTDYTYNKKQQKVLNDAYSFYHWDVTQPIDDEMPIAESVLKSAAYFDARTFKTVHVCFKYFARQDDEYRRVITTLLREVRHWYQMNCYRWH